MRYLFSPQGESVLNRFITRDTLLAFDFDGTLEHHDAILTKVERDAGKTMMICVSRCSGKRLVLDI